MAYLCFDLPPVGCSATLQAGPRIRAGRLSHSMANLETKARATFFGHEDGVTCTAMCNERLFSTSYDMTVREWNLDNMHCLRVFTGGGCGFGMRIVVQFW